MSGVDPEEPEQAWDPRKAEGREIKELSDKVK